MGHWTEIKDRIMSCELVKVFAIREFNKSNNTVCTNSNDFIVFCNPHEVEFSSKAKRVTET